MNERCEWCGRFGARKVLSHIPGARGINNPEGKVHLYLCAKCEDAERTAAWKKAKETVAVQP